MAVPLPRGPGHRDYPPRGLELGAAGYTDASVRRVTLAGQAEEPTSDSVSVDVFAARRTDQSCGSYS